MNRTELFQRAAERLRSDFEESRVIEHSGVKGSEAEKLVRKFLNDHLPGRFRAGSGFIVDHKGAASPQTDVVIYDALNCPVYRLSDDGSVFPSDNVAAVVEVKSTLDKAELQDAWEKIALVKALDKTPDTDPGPFTTTNTIGLVFAFDCATSIDAIAKNYTSLLRQNGFDRHVDAILVLDEAVIFTSVRYLGSSTWYMWLVDPSATNDGADLATSTSFAKRHSLDLLFRLLLTQLTRFRARVDHPGFDLPDPPLRRVRYVTSVTHETDVKRRAEIFRERLTHVRAEFGKGNLSNEESIKTEDGSE
jgi:hypothetical protein